MLLKTAFHGVAKAWFVFADIWTPGGSLKSPDAIEFKHLEPLPQHHNEIKLLESSSQPHATLDLSCKNNKNKKKKKKRNDVGENLETIRDVEEQLDEEARAWFFPRTVSKTHLDKDIDESLLCSCSFLFLFFFFFSFPFHFSVLIGKS